MASRDAGAAGFAVCETAAAADAASRAHVSARILRASNGRLERHGVCVMGHLASGRKLIGRAIRAREEAFRPWVADDGLGAGIPPDGAAGLDRNHAEVA